TRTGLKGVSVDLDADRPLEDERVLVLEGMRMHGCSECPWGERVLEQREPPLAGFAPEQHNCAKRPLKEHLPVVEAALVPAHHRLISFLSQIQGPRRSVISIQKIVLRIPCGYRGAEIRRGVASRRGAVRSPIRGRTDRPLVPRASHVPRRPRS